MSQTRQTIVTQKLQPTVFCSQCGRYIGAAERCHICDWQRPVGERIPKEGEALWRYRAQAGWRGQPLLHQACLIASDLEGRLHALSCADGTPLWEEPAPLGSPARSIVAHGDHLFASTRSGDVVALAADTGQELNRKRLGESAGALALGPDRLYLGTSEGQVFELTLAGLEARPFPHGLGQAITAAPVLAANVLLVATRHHRGRVAAFIPGDGSRLWEYDLGGRISLSPAVVGDRVVVATEEGKVWAFSLKRGTLLWPDPRLVGERVSCLSADDTAICLGTWGGEVVTLGWDGRVIVRRRLGQGVVTGLACWGKLRYAALRDGCLHLLAGPGLTQCGSYQMEAGITAGPLTADGIIYVGDAGGNLVALPWHLGAWGWAAGWCRAQGEPAAAAAFHALTADTESAATLWEGANLPEKAARLWSSLGQDARAAQAYVAAAELHTGSAPARAAGFFNLAADHFRLACLEREEQVHRHRAARMGRFPRLAVALHNLPVMVAGEPGCVALRVRNDGNERAEAITFFLGGQLAHLVEKKLKKELPPGREIILEIDRLIPTALDKSDLIARLTYRDPHGLEHFSEPPPFTLEATQPPPGIHVVDSEVGMLKVVVPEGAPEPTVRIIDSTMGMVRVDESS